MVNFALYEDIARTITSIITSEEKNVFPGRGLDSVARGVSTIRFHAMNAMLETEGGLSSARYLLEDFSLEDAARETLQQWRDGWIEATTKPLLLASESNIAAWRDHPDYKRFTDLIPGVKMSILCKDTDIFRNGEQYAIMMFEPEFPEWYIFTKGPHAMSDEDRVTTMRTIVDELDQFIPTDGRIKPDQLDILYYHFVQEVVSELQAASETNAAAKKRFITWYSMYNLCGLEFTSENIYELPQFYKEFMIFFCDAIYEESQVPRLLALARQAA
ncbi:hypothetical protein HFN89_05730 [Rhizobium laguerreae]|nr:hypothetical protein [Rhizobium laguerreae]